MPTRTFKLLKAKRKILRDEELQKTRTQEIPEFEDDLEVNKEDLSPKKGKRQSVNKKNKTLQNSKADNLEECEDDLKDNTNNVTTKKKRKLDMKDRLHNITDCLNVRTKHCLIPSFNLSFEAVNDFSELFKTLSCDFKAPEPLYIAQRHPETIDICFQRTRMYEHFKSRLTSGRTRYHNYLKRNKKLAGLEAQNMYHSHVYTFAERIYSDPDPFFRGSYDYYYSGGNLAILDSPEPILHVDGAQLRDLNVSYYEDNTFKTIYNSINCAENSEIFELRKFPSNETSYAFILRQLNKISVNSLEFLDDEEEAPQLNTIINFQSKVPLISFSHIPNSENQLMVSNMRQQVRLYDFNTSETKQLQLYKLGENKTAREYELSWNAVKPINASNFCYVNERELQIIDLRTTQDQWLTRELMDLHNIYVCDHNSALALSQWNPLVYVGTAHHLHCVDTRQLGKKNAIFSWTHQMSYPPAFIDTLPLPQSELIALSSAVAGEIRICELHKTSESDIYKSPTLPYEPPKLMESYHHARNNGCCLQVGAHLSRRLRCCTTGLSFMPNVTAEQSSDDEEFISVRADFVGLLLFSNSNGDLFKHQIVKNEDSMVENTEHFNEESDTIMHNLAESVCKLAPPILKCTAVRNAKGLSKIFRCKNLSKSPDISNKNNENRLGRWQRSYRNLKSFKDALANDILSIWDIDDEERELNTLKIDRTLQEPPLSKMLVDRWLDHSSIFTQTPPPATVMAENNITDTIIQPMETNFHPTELSYIVPNETTEIVNMEDLSHISSLNVLNVTIPDAVMNPLDDTIELNLIVEKRRGSPLESNSKRMRNKSISPCIKEETHTPVKRETKDKEKVDSTPTKNDTTININQTNSIKKSKNKRKYVKGF